MTSRDALLELVGRKIAALRGRPMVAIDGVDGSGKSTFANELAPVVKKYGRPVLRASIDGFHNPRSIRYRRGRGDPEGYFMDSYDYGSFNRFLIEPFRAGASAIRTSHFDLKGDREVTLDRCTVRDGSILLIDGIFLHRDELQDLWDQSVFLDVPFSISFARMQARDGMNPNPLAAENHRYLEG